MHVATLHLGLNHFTGLSRTPGVFSEHEYRLIRPLKAIFYSNRNGIWNHEHRSYIFLVVWTKLHLLTGKMIRWFIGESNPSQSWAHLLVCVFFIHTMETFFKRKARLCDAFPLPASSSKQGIVLTHHKHLGDIIPLVFSITGNRWKPGTLSRPRSMEVNDRAAAQDDCMPLTSERWCGLWGTSSSVGRIDLKYRFFEPVAELVPRSVSFCQRK